MTSVSSAAFNMSRLLKDKLEAALGVSVVEMGPLPVGFGLDGAVVRLADGRHLAVKARTLRPTCLASSRAYQSSQSRMSIMPMQIFW